MDEEIVQALAFQGILSLRIYDVLLALLAETNPAKADALKNMHREGRTLSPAPALVEGAFDADTNS